MDVTAITRRREKNHREFEEKWTAIIDKVMYIMRVRCTTTALRTIRNCSGEENRAVQEERLRKRARGENCCGNPN